MIQQVKEFFEEFAKYEAEMEVLKFQLDVQPYNNGREKGNAYYVEPNVPFMPKEPWDEDELAFCGNIGKPMNRYPRTLFKISQYTHKKYGDVWLCFCSLQDHGGERIPSSLIEILFVVKEGDNFKIASQYSYSDYESDGKYYEWGKDNVAHHDLKIEDLEGPVKIERYQEPDDYLEGKKHYNKDW